MNKIIQELEKYYTPEIEELLNTLINKESIYRLEYDNIIEIKSYNNIEDTLYNFIEMNDCQWKYDFENKIIKSYSINPNMYLLKYLDKEDIESLGFEQQTLPYQFKKDWYRLIKRREENQYIIEDGRYIDQIFVGTIKNKSELKKLLTQLNIN